MIESQPLAPLVSVVIPARGASATLPECLRSLFAQSMSRGEFEVIVVVDRGAPEGDAVDHVAAAGASVVVSPGRGAGAARNAGVAFARGDWIAFLDADCIPSRRWLSALIGAANDGDEGPPSLGAAGATLGYESRTPAAKYVDLTGGLSAEKHLAHPRFPWAPTSNALYRRAALLAVGGFDERFVSYEGCDLHTRLLRTVGGSFSYVPTALVYHRHRAGWRAYWRQQLNYGRGYGQFFRRYRDELGWSPLDETRSWISVAASGLAALLMPRGDAGLIRRGTVVKKLALRIGFARTFWNPREARRWRRKPSPGIAAAP